MTQPPVALKVGSVLSRSFSIWSKNLIPFSALALIIQSPIILYCMFAPVSGGLSVWMYSTVSGLVAPVFSLVTGAAVAYGVFQQMRGQTVTLNQCIKVGLSRLLPVLGTAVLVGLVIVGGLILLIVPGLIFACVYYVAIPAAVVEKTGPMASMRRSAFLTKGARVQVFVVALLLGLAVFAVNWVIGRVTGSAPPAVTTYDITKIMADTYNAMRLQTVIGLIVGAVLGCLTSVATVVIYYDLRVQKEQVDLEKIAAVFA